MKKYLLTIFTILMSGIFLGYQKTESLDTQKIPAISSNQNNLGGNQPGPVISEDSSTQTQPQAIPKQTVSSNPTKQSVSSPIPVKQTVSNTGLYKDGTYVGNSADAYYGNIQVEAVIKGGQIADVVFLDYPSDRSTSLEINSYAMPRLKSEAISAQSANVDIVSRATDSSLAFRESLASALAYAIN